MPKPTVEDVYHDLELSARSQKKLHKQMQEDIEFALGKQWADEDVDVLRKAGVLPLTINQIKPMVKIITGIERQSKSDFVAFPEGKEDTLLSEIITRLLKNVVKRSSLEKKTSDQFKEGVICGLAYIEPYLDYTYDLINGEMRFRKVNADRIFLSPEGEEYDLSDRSYVIKCSFGLSKDQLLEMFPDKEKKINEVGFSKIDLKDIDGLAERVQTRDYTFERKNELGKDVADESFDLVEYYYKSPKSVYYVADKLSGSIQEFSDKQEAEFIVAQGVAQGQDLVIIHKKVPEIRVKQVVGDVELSDDVAWSYPRWKSYPVFPFYFERMTASIDSDELLIQGLVRSLKDLQLELNKSRTLELRHINSTVNSGWSFPKGAFDDKNKDIVKKLGSTPGVVVEYDPSKTGGTVSPETFRIRPADLPQAHMALSSERINDIKEASGVNPNLLANDSESQSGRAILLKQRQGLVMIQEALDNYGETKKLIGRFILTQLGEIFTVETALQVLGDSFLKENFERPQLNEDGSVAMDDKGQVVMAVDQNEVTMIVNKILNDSALGKYDVSIGEGAYSETSKLANYTMLMDMVSKGIPIPPEMIIEESMLSDSQKKKIGLAVEQAKQAVLAAQAPAMMGGTA